MADFKSAAASALGIGIDSMAVITGPTNGLADNLQIALKDQEDERKKKLAAQTNSLAAQSLLGNATGGFGG